MALNVKIVSVACKVCGRPLKSPASIEKGVGPVCGGGFKKSYRRLRDDDTLDMFNAEFAYKFRDGVLVIHDANRGGKSVTNDMENVLKRIIKETGKPDHDTPIVYLDSMQQFDGVQYNPVTDKVTFLPIRAAIEEDAIQKVKEAFNELRT